MLFFIGSESFFFIALIIAYIYYSHPGGKLAETAHYLDIKKTAFFTFFLLASSVSIGLAGMKYSQGNRKQALSWLALTIILGIIFLSGQAAEYSRLIHQNVTISKNVFGSSFFTLTGFHGLHECRIRVHFLCNLLLCHHFPPIFTLLESYFPISKRAFAKSIH